MIMKDAFKNNPEGAAELLFELVVDHDRVSELFEELNITDNPLAAAEGFVDELQDHFIKLLIEYSKK